MSTLRRIGTGCLVGLVFAAGYTARLHNMVREEAFARAFRQAPVSAPGTQVASAGLESAGSIDLRPLEIMLTVLTSLREHYVDQISPKDEGKMTHDSLRAMLASLGDQHTRFVDPDQRKLISDAAAGNFHGIGVILGVKRIKTGQVTDEHLIVVTPVESGPAAAAGLKPGDDIVAINGRAVLPFNPYQKANEIMKDDEKKSVERSQIKKHLDAEKDRIDNGIGLIEAENMLVSEDKKEVELSVARKGSPKELKMKITPREFAVNPITSSVIEDGKLGYIKINCFSQTTGEEFQNAVRDLRSKEVKGLVLDLRNVAGGGIEPVLEVAKPLLSGKALGIERKSRNRKSTIRVAECTPDDAWRGPMAVIVNSGTARMSEALAAALRDGASAKLVGEKTYGDCSVVTLIDQRDGSAVAMTTGMLVPSRGADYQGKGLTVDAAVPAAPGDPQLKEAVKLILSKVEGLSRVQALGSTGGKG